MLSPNFSLFLSLLGEKMFLFLLCMSWQALREQAVERAAGLASVGKDCLGSTGDRGQSTSHERPAQLWSQETCWLNWKTAILSGKLSSSPFEKGEKPLSQGLKILRDWQAALARTRAYSLVETGCVEEGIVPQKDLARSQNVVFCDPNKQFFFFFLNFLSLSLLDFPGILVIKNLPVNAGDSGHLSLIPGSWQFNPAGLERSPGGGNVNPLQYYCLENSMDRGAWWVRVHGVTKSWTPLSDRAWLNTHGPLIINYS